MVYSQSVFVPVSLCLSSYKNMYNIIYETSHQSRFDARYWMLGAGALGQPRGMVWGGRREEGSEWGTHVYLWQMHVDIWQNQYNIVKLKNKIKYILKKSVTGFRPTLIPCGFIFTCLLSVISAKTKWDFQMRSHSLTVRTWICLSGGYNLTPEWRRIQALKEYYIEEVFLKKNVA